MVGRRSPQTPSINRLTSRPDSVLSKCRRSRHIEFQHIKRRHPRYFGIGQNSIQCLLFFSHRYSIAVKKVIERQCMPALFR
jgi:hypothetical protein